MVRLKNRYLLVELVWGDGKIDESLNSKAILHLIQQQLRTNFGDWGFALTQLSLQVKYFNSITNTCIVRVARDQQKILWNCLTLIREYRNRPLTIRILHIGGTIRACQKMAIKYPLVLPASVQTEDDQITEMVYEV